MPSAGAPFPRDRSQIAGREQDYLFTPHEAPANGMRATPGDRLSSSAPLPDRDQHVEIGVGSEPQPLSLRNGLVSSRCALRGVAVDETANPEIFAAVGWVGG